MVPLRQRVDFYLAAVSGSRLWYFNFMLTLVSIVFGLATISGRSGVKISAVVLSSASFVIWVADWIRHRAASRNLSPREVHPAFNGLRVESGTVIRFPRVGPVREKWLAELAREKRFDVAVSWDEIDSELPGTKARFRWSRRRKEISVKVRPFVNAVLANVYEHNRGSLFNGKVVRQDEDLSADVLRSEKGTVNLSRTRYFSMVVTNYLVERDLVDGKGRVVFRGSSLVTGAPGDPLETLKESSLANVIGASTLAFAEDNLAVLVRQSSNSLSSGLLWAPGSGSMDLRDVRSLRFVRSQPLAAIIRATMERELTEEASLQPDEIMWTEINGYFRWVNKGGKPEYVGVTRLQGNANDFKGRRVRLTERGYVDSVETVTIDLERLMAEPSSLRCIESEEVRVAVSMPLFMCLRAFGRRLQSDERLRRQFIPSRR
ncbi:hypothetical protein [Actinoplanes sp. NPDC051851]|uniref:hypothetical protein n=1 Tax=Actinoplanes sp. NPDC051851 TaxID=3154753 RepID=UPI00343FDB62